MLFVFFMYVGVPYGFKQDIYDILTHKESSAFSFVDPAHVVRGCHLIPAFAAGRSADLLPWPRSIARRLEPGTADDKDWLNFYANM